MTVQLSTEILRNMVEVGFLSVGQGFNQETQAIVSGLKTLRPDDATPYMIESFNLMNMGQYEKASVLLQEKALFRAPDDDLVKSFLAFNLIKSGFPNQANSLLDEALISEDPVAKNFANQVLNFSKQ